MPRHLPAAMTDDGWPGHAARPAATIFPYLESAGRTCEAVTAHRQAMRASRLTGDSAGQATALGNLAVIDRRLGRYEQAARRQVKALALYRQSGDEWGEALTLTRRRPAATWSPSPGRGSCATSTGPVPPGRRPIR